MRNLFLPISIGLLCTSFTLIPSEPASLPTTGSKVQAADLVSHAGNRADEIYQLIRLEQYGLSQEAFQYAWTGYNHLLDQQKISRQHLLTICDFSQSSRQKRLYVIDLDKKEVLINTWVAHGRNSGDEYARQFSNTPESLQSSLGFYVTAGTYTGKHGLSLRLHGKDPGFNDNAFFRTIVMHGAAYVDEARLKAGMYMGRSWGCPAVPQQESEKIIQTIKNGSCLFIYHPTRNYLKYSTLLNG